MTRGRRKGIEGRENFDSVRNEGKQNSAGRVPGVHTVRNWGGNASAPSAPTSRSSSLHVIGREDEVKISAGALCCKLENKFKYLRGKCE